MSISLLFSYCQKANFEYGRNKKVKFIYLTAQKLTTSEPILHVRLKKAKKQLFIRLKNAQIIPEIVFGTFFFANLVRFKVEF